MRAYPNKAYTRGKKVPVHTPAHSAANRKKKAAKAQKVKKTKVRK